MTDTDSKTKKLQAKYGKKILGLTNENEQRVIDEIVMPALIEKTPDLI
jgi:flagellar biosynthesis chaperone FliJ